MKPYFRTAKSSQNRSRFRLSLIAVPMLLSGAALGCLLFVPPLRDRFFAAKLWPWGTPWDITSKQLEELRALAEPGDVLIESNLHGWQWMALCLATTGTSWVHAALVNENKNLLTVHKLAIEVDWSIYLEWGSTRLALIRPPYKNPTQLNKAIEFARSKLGTVYDPSFRDHAGNCNGLVGSALHEAGIEVQSKSCLGREIYPGDCFLRIPGMQVVWTNN